MILQVTRPLKCFFHLLQFVGIRYFIFIITISDIHILHTQAISNSVNTFHYILTNNLLLSNSQLQTAYRLLTLPVGDDRKNLSRYIKIPFKIYRCKIKDDVAKLRHI